MQKKGNLKRFGGLAAFAIIAVFIVFSCEIPDNLLDNGNKVAFTGLSADGSVNLTTSKLTLTFDKDIDGLVNADIVLTPSSTGAEKGVLTHKSAGNYELLLKNITVGGMVTVSVAKSGYNITGGPKQVTIFYKEGSIIEPEPSDIPSELIAKWYTHQSQADTDYQFVTYEITADGDFYMMGVKSDYTLTVEGDTITFLRHFDNQITTVKYSVSGTVLTLTNPSSSDTPLQGGPFYKKAGAQGNNDTEVEFTGLTQDGSSTQTTTKLTLTFDKEIDGLEASDIIFNAGTTDASKVTLTKIDMQDNTGKYELSINVLATGGTVSISVSKNGYNITGGPHSATIFSYDDQITGTTPDGIVYTYGRLTQKITITSYLSYTGNMYNIIIPAQIDNKPLIAIGSYYEVYSGNSASPSVPSGSQVFVSTTSITIPNGVTHIGGFAVIGSGESLNLVIPNSVTYIGDYAFYRKNIVDFTLPENISYIGANAFNSYSNNDNLTSIVIPNSVTFLGGGALRIGRNILNVTIGANVEFTSYSGGAYGCPIDAMAGTGNNLFVNFYINNGRKAGKYSRPNNWSDWTKVE
jgi:cytochrome c-type biogenesis protein CcmE